MDQKELSSETKKWSDSLELINKELTTIKDRKDILVMQQNMLDENRKTTGANTGLNFEEMKKYFDFYSIQISVSRKEWTSLGEREVKLNEVKNKLSQQLYDFQQKSLHHQVRFGFRFLQIKQSLQNFIFLT